MNGRAGRGARPDRHSADGIFCRRAGFRRGYVHVRSQTLHVDRATYSLPIVTKRLRLRWSIALLVVVGTAVSYGAARQSLAELKAMSCCAHDCGHDPAKAADPSRCCGVAPASAAASVAPAAPSPAPVQLATLIAAPATITAVPSLAADSPDLAAARAAPIFLLTRSLRI